MEPGFLAVGQLPALFAAFSSFDLSALVWVLLGPPGGPISPNLLMPPAARMLMIAAPVLSGVLLCIVADLLQQHRHHEADDDRHRAAAPRRQRGSRSVGTPPLPSAPRTTQRILSHDRGQSA
jgi:hypothetical protein